jgi:hypothetical protein
VALSPDLRSLFASSEMVTLTLSTPCSLQDRTQFVSILMYWLILWPMQCVVMPAKLSIPLDYPIRSPILITDEGDDQLRWVHPIRSCLLPVIISLSKIRTCYIKPLSQHGTSAGKSAVISQTQCMRHSPSPSANSQSPVRSRILPGHGIPVCGRLLQSFRSSSEEGRSAQGLGGGKGTADEIEQYWATGVCRLV